MNGDVSQAGQPDSSAPELRASHADRDHVVEVLRVAAGDGRLTAEELDERLEAALTARTYRELAVLTADLPAAAQGTGVPGGPPRDLMRISHIGGSVRHAGRWPVPRRMQINVAGGNVRLDFTDAVIAAPVLDIDAQLKGGSLIIITRPGVSVETGDLTMVGGRIVDRTSSQSPAPALLAVRVSGDMRGGNIRIGPPRRTFLEWLLRRRTPT